MPEKRRKSKSRDCLSLHERWSLTVGDYGDVFASDDERRAAWQRHRDELLAESRAGRRPAAWWDYDAEIARPNGDDCQEPALYKAGLLSESELAELMPWWREQYDEAYELSFEFCTGQDEQRQAVWLKGAAAKRAQYKWAGIPPEIIKRWNSRRRKEGHR
jgi:hypothetical protein